MSDPAHAAHGGHEEAAFSISVVMPLYVGTPADQLRSALQSLYTQTLPPLEIIVVEDGPLTPAHTHVLGEFAGIERPPLRRIPLAENHGGGVATQTGVEAARGVWVAKMDADDLCLPTRFAQQVATLRDEDVDLVGGAMLEFHDEPARPVALRVMPTSHADIVKAMRINNPVNHPTVVFRRDLALRVGGYADMRMEDYDLWARMLQGGAHMRNLSEPVLMFRADDKMFARRASWALIRAEWRLQRNLRSYGIIGPLGQARNLALRLGFRLLPRPLLRFGYRKSFTKPVEAPLA